MKKYFFKQDVKAYLDKRKIKKIHHKDVSTHKYELIKKKFNLNITQI